MLVAAVLGGCALISRRYAGPNPQAYSPAGALPNPSLVPVSNLDFAWNQIVDMVDDYFEIAREQQVRPVGDVLIEGFIETKPLEGATILEPLRRDSTPGFERWQSTLQSIRRTAQVRVIPAPGGFEVYLNVWKELEDVSYPEFATLGQATQRHDGSLVRFDGFQTVGPATLGWIPLGRDIGLEQEMLANLHARLHEVSYAYGVH
jgi:hypothetical protein